MPDQKSMRTRCPGGFSVEMWVPELLLLPIRIKSFDPINPFRRHNLHPTLEISIRNFQNFPKFSKIFQKLPKVTKSYQKLPKVTKSYQKLPKVTKSY